ncbi:flippase-like domain-containing protein [Candidatus Saccharibacteria bacterium]|nr:flippase-like domain-containing protein [Candidatus Saccharibacteria bacterium]
MAETSYFRRNWKMIVNIVTLVALIILIYAIRDQFKQTFENLFRVNAWALLLMLPAQFFNYDAQTRLYRSLFAVVGNKISYKKLFKVGLELNFVNHVFPSGGVTGISYWGLRMKSKDVTSARATAVHLQKLVMLFLSFEILIVVAVFSLAVQGHMSNIILLLAGSITTVLLILTAGFGFIIGSKKRIAGFFTYMTRALNKLIRKFRPNRPDTINTEGVRALFEDLHENYVYMSKDWRALRRPFFWAFMANLSEIVTIYIVYIAFGEFVNIGAVILAYAVANFAGLISVLPGGIGVYEALMTLTLSATGVPSRLSLPVTVMYRVINTVIQLPPGYYLYHKNLSRKPELEQLTHPDSSSGDTN